jgi:ABC-type transporter Mla subunit MlaD
MLRRPVEAPEPLGHLGSGSAAVSFRRLVSDRTAGTRRSLRAWAGRLSGRADRRLLRAQADVTEAVVARCDLLADRLSALEAATADVAGAFGEELARLRAEVAHLRRTLDAPRDPAS